MFLRTIEVLADLRVVRTIVPRAARGFGLGYMSMLRPICRPLHHYARSNNAGDYRVHELELWDLEVIHALVSFPNASTNVKDCLFVDMEKLEGGSDARKLGVV